MTPEFLNPVYFALGVLVAFVAGRYTFMYIITKYGVNRGGQILYWIRLGLLAAVFVSLLFKTIVRILE